MWRHSGLFTWSSCWLITGRKKEKLVFNRSLCLPHRLHRWTRCHKTRTSPYAWGSRAAGGRASRGASAWRSSDWGRESHWRRRWRSGPEREAERECVMRLIHIQHNHMLGCCQKTTTKERREEETGMKEESDRRIPAAASSGRSSGSPPHCGCSGWAVPGSAAPALGLDKSKEEKHDEVSADKGMCIIPVQYTPAKNMYLIISSIKFFPWWAACTTTLKPAAQCIFIFYFLVEICSKHLIMYRETIKSVCEPGLYAVIFSPYVSLLF